MADAKRIAIRILRGIGKGIWIFCKALGRGIKREYREYQAREKIRKSEQRYYHDISREAYSEERGRQKAIYEARATDRARREEEKYWKSLPDRFEKAVYNNPFEDEFKSKKRKRR